MSKLRIGAVSYLNTRPLVYGMERGLGAERIRLSYATPAVLADRLAGGELDVALLPVIELARIPGLECVPGLGIVTRGTSRSVLLVSRRPAEAVRSLALDADSRTSNALARVLLARAGSTSVAIHGPASTDLEQCLRAADAVVRIGDKALAEPPPRDARVYDLGELWTRETGLPFVYAVWAARAGIVDGDLYRVLHESRRRGSRAIERIAADYTWNGEPRPELARQYLTEHIRFRLGAGEIRAIDCFLAAAHGLGLIDAIPTVRLALSRRTACHEMAAARGVGPGAGG